MKIIIESEQGQIIIELKVTDMDNDQLASAIASALLEWGIEPEEITVNKNE